MRLVVVTVLSTLLSALVVSNAYMEKKQFYPTVVYLLTSNRSLGVMYLQGFVMVWFLCKFLKTMFFGTLRAAEVEVRPAVTLYHSCRGRGKNHEYFAPRKLP